jgi:hypothetical protein
MAFNARGLAPIGPLNNNELPTLWMYATADAAATVDTAGYFPVGYGIKLGDIIQRVTYDAFPNPTSVSTAGTHLVNSVSATSIDVADTLAITVTDTD